MDFWPSWQMRLPIPGFCRLTNNSIQMYYCLNNFISVSKDFGLCSIYNLISKSSIFADEIAYVFLSSLSYEPQNINEVSKKILRHFKNVDLNQVINDATEYFDSLVSVGILSKGRTEDECFSNRVVFSYEHQHEIRQRFESFKHADEDIFSQIRPQRNIQLKNLHIELTSKCNERCIHCYIPHEQKTTDMSMNTFNKLFEEIKSIGIKSVILSGGECMMHPFFLDILKHFKAENIHVTILTNLTLLNQEIIDVLSNGLLSFVQVSLFSLDEEIHDRITQKKGSWKNTMKNIEMLRHANIPVKIASQCFKDTISSQEELIAWCVQQGYSFSIDLDIVGKTDGDTSNLCNRVDDMSLYQRIIEVKDKLDPSFVDKLHVGNCPDYHICNVGVSTLSISSSGDVYPCVGFTSYRLGNVNDSSLVEIWENSPALNKLRELRLKDFKICSKCEDKDYCNVCMQYNSSVTGDIFTPDKRKCMITHMLKSYATSKV